MIFGALGLSFLVCYLAMPSIIRIGVKWGVVDAPSYRKSHKSITPTIGGVGIFLSTVLISLLLIPSSEMGDVRFIFAALTVIFLVGARDDLDPLTPFAKLTGQLIAVALLIFFADVRVSSMYGLFGIWELPFTASIVLTTIFYLYLINSFNLIDGIDGLCSSVSILVLGILGTWFFMSGVESMAILSFTTAGATLAFLKFNISPSKIFMGDTGSLVLGTVCTVMLVEFMEYGAIIGEGSLSFKFNLAIGLFILPAFDTLRVFIHRIINGRSPFQPDQNHLHHLLLRSGLGHMHATVTLLVFNSLFVLLALYFRELDPTSFFVLTLILACFLTSVLHVKLYLRGQDIFRTDP